MLEANYRPCGHDEMGQLMQKVLAQIGRALMDLSYPPPGFGVVAAVPFCPRLHAELVHLATWDCGSQFRTG